MVEAAVLRLFWGLRTSDPLCWRPPDRAPLVPQYHLFVSGRPQPTNPASGFRLPASGRPAAQPLPTSGFRLPPFVSCLGRFKVLQGWFRVAFDPI